jgi:hypothetical protein
VKSSRASVVSSFTIIKGAMIDETYRVFRDWDFELSREENLQRMRETNSIGADSANWLRDVAFVLHRRFDPAGPDRPLVELAQLGCGYETWKPLLLWHMTRDELLLRDFLVNWLFPQYQGGTYRVRTDEVEPYLKGLHRRKLIKEAWKETTLKRVASGLLRLACDFGLMRGTLEREFESYHLPEESFLYILHAMVEVQPNARELVRSPDWRMFLMDADDVERELFRLHQYRKVRYEAAGSIAQLVLPSPTAAAYIKEMAL